MNMVFATLIPFLIIFIFIIVVIKGTSNKVFFKTARTSKLIIVSYVVLLSVGVLIAYLLPNPNLANEPDIDVGELQYVDDNFYNIADSGKLAETAGIYETDKWSFGYDEEQLTVLENGGNWIIYEKKSGSDRKIDVIRYSTKYIVNSGLDFTDEIEPPTVELSDNQLTITEPPLVNIRVAQFHKEFTITQFTGESMFNDRNPVMGRDVIVIRVPVNVEIVTNQQDGVHYIND
ncbi:hypothetical protein RJD24_17185 [Bacillaceae bacterium IKA-2]|nr:hypothetical protein RJD24_17185 [Bacillaceae bacterium IKA-2]